jgi:YVTN family beta-propeller protein
VLSVAWLQSWSRRSVHLPKFGFRGFQRIVSLDRRSRIFRSELLQSPGLRGDVTAGGNRPPLIPGLAPAMLGIAALLAGCGETPRPVVTPVAVTGPAPQPQSYAVVTTTSGLGTAGLANVFDAAGDTLLTQALLGNGPLALTLSSTAGSATTANTDGTVNTFTPSTTLQTKNIQSSTLLQPAQPVNLLSTATNLYITEPDIPAVAVLSNNSSGIFQLTQQLPVPASPINLAGNSNASRVYSITQDNGSNQVAFGDCETPAQVTTPGQVQSIETSTVTISRTLPVGICPVYGIGSTDNNRVFILNRGSGTVTVINSQFNELDTTPNLPNLNPATGTIVLPPPAGVAPAAFNAGPVFADYYTPTAQLVTANYDSNTITIINTNLDVFGNDSSLFGQAVTVAVGNGPDTLTILRDGSRVYVANQKDSTVSVVSLTSFKVLATIPVTGHPISMASTFSTPDGQIYVLASDQPYMTVIRTDTDKVSAAIQLDGTGVDVHTSAQSVAANSSTTGTVANAINVSHASGSGAPCGFGAPCTTSTGAAARRARIKP